MNPFQNGDVEAWDEPHDIVGMEELSHDIYDDVQIEQIDGIKPTGGRCGRDRIVVGLTTTCAIRAYPN